MTDKELLFEALQAAEERGKGKIWGGSNLAAGSDSEWGSSLDWKTVRDIAESIVKDAYREAGLEPD